MYYSYVEIEYVATGFSPARTDLALKLLKAITADPGKPSSTLLLVRAGREEVLSNGCSAKPSIALGRMSIKEERPKSMVVFES